MASITLSNVSFYKNGTSGYSSIVGRESSSNRVARYKFTSPSTGASSVSISIPTIGLQGGSHISIRYYITTSSSSHANAGSGSTYTGTLSRSGNTFSASTTILLLPNTTYYLWVFPGSTTYGYYGWASTSGTAKLTTYGAAQSDISGSAGTLGVENNLTLTRYSSVMTHTVTAKCGSASVTIGTDIQADTVTWTPPVEWAAQNTSGTSVSVVVTCVTYQGDTELGSTTVTLSFEIPVSVAPSVRFTVSDPQGHLGVFGSYVQSKSQALVNVTAAGVYGSTIKSYSVQCGSLAGTASEVTFELPASGKITITVKVTDSRGRTASVSSDISVAAYAVPSVSITSRYRCDVDGNEDPEGAYALVVFDADITSLDSKNTASYAALYRVRGDEEWASADLNAYEGNYAPRKASAIIPADASEDYEVSIRATDYFGSVDSTYRTVQVAFKLYEVCKSRKAWGFGQKATVDNAVSFGLQVIMNAGQTADSYQGSGDDDETALNAWLDTHLDSMVSPGVKPVAIRCYPVAGSETLFGFLCCRDDETALLFAWSASNALYFKVKTDGVWQNTVIHSLT